MTKAGTRTIGIGALALSVIVLGARWQLMEAERNEVFRGGAPTAGEEMTDAARADLLVKMVELVRRAGMEPAKEDFEWPDGWRPPESWEPPKDWQPPVWWP